MILLYRLLATKNFDGGLVSSNLILENLVVYTNTLKRYGKIDNVDTNLDSLDAKSSMLGINLAPLRELLLSNEDLSDVLRDENGDIRSLQDISQSTDVLSLSSDSRLSDLALVLFNNTNPLTGNGDVSKFDKYAGDIALSFISGVLPAQRDEDDNAYFNPLGTITVAEFLDGLNAIECGSNSSSHRKKSLDNVSDEKDFFNEGYQSCVSLYSSPFYNLYTRKELFNPITRLELAYITVICWSKFIKKFGTPHTNKFGLGISLDWGNVSKIIKDFDDGKDYLVSEKYISDSSIVSINIKDYLGSTSISDYMRGIKDGRFAIPLPMFMCLLELNELDIFPFENFLLSPVKEVSREEFAYFIIRLASILGGRNNEENM